MANKKHSLLAVLLLLLLSIPLFAAEPAPSEAEETEEMQFEQRIEWKADAAALEYKVEVQSEAGGEITAYSTDQTHLDLSLSVGTWKYRVHAIDFLGREAAVSEWRSFAVFKASIPEIDVIQSSVTYSSADSTIKLPVVILNINVQSTVELENIANKKKYKVTVVLNESSGGKESAVSEVFRSSSVSVAAVPQGLYRINVTNQSGLSAQSESITVIRERGSKDAEQEEREREELIRLQAEEEARKRLQEGEDVDTGEEAIIQKEAEIEILKQQLAKRGNGPTNKQLVFLLGAGFAPYDGSFENLTGLVAAPMAGFQYTILPFINKTNTIRFGFEFYAQEVLYPVFNDYIESFLSASLAGAKIVYQQRIFTDSLSYSVKTGLSAAAVFAELKYIDDFTGRSETELIFRVYPAVNAGLSLDWKPSSKILISVGADATYILSVTMPTLSIIPYVGVGVHW